MTSAITTAIRELFSNYCNLLQKSEYYLSKHESDLYDFSFPIKMREIQYIEINMYVFLY